MRACADRWRELNPDITIEWESHSLRSFGDERLNALAGRFDLLVIDHPACGEAERDGALRPLDQLLPADAVAQLAEGSVGPSHRSYTYHGHQWALGTDAACQVAAVRPDLVGATPSTWEEVLSLAVEQPGSVALPLTPPHAISSWLTLVANQGGDPFTDEDAGVQAMDILLGLARAGPAEALEWEPPDALGRMSSTDEILYIPLTYGYSMYATGAVARPCRFADVPSSGLGPTGAVLGGAGLAVSRSSDYPEQAARFAAWASNSEAQHDIVATHDGQPGHRSAWDDPTLDALAGGFYSDTRRSIEHAWVRPREPWYPEFQLRGGKLLTDALREHADAYTTTQGLHELYRGLVA
jgi:multiple sugar transport system substrate-binding protein